MFNISCQHEIAELSEQKFNEKIYETVKKTAFNASMQINGEFFFNKVYFFIYNLFKNSCGRCLL